MATSQVIQQNNAPTSSKSGPPVRAFSGTFLWVTHDAGHMKAAPNRHQVFTHIQKQYRPWKKKTSVRPRKPTKSLPSTVLLEEEDEDFSEVVRPPSPTSLVARGNSDPFFALPIAIGPAENDLICFYRDYYLPAQYSNKQMHVEKLMKKDWQDCMDGMLDEGIAHGSLARWAHMTAPRTPRHYTTAIKHQLQAVQSLQRKLAQGEELQTYQNYMHLNMLFSAETISRNIAGARVYGNMFKKLFDEAWQRGTLDFTLLLYQVHNDVQTCAMSLLPTVFDLDVFVPRAIEPLRELCLAELPIVNAEEVNSTLSTTPVEPLAGFFRSLRLFWATVSRSTKGQGSASIHMGTLNSFQDCMHVGQAVNHYNYFKEQLKWQWKRSERVMLLVQLSLCLGALYMAKSFNIDHRTLGRPIFDMRPAVLSALRDHLQDFAALARDAEKQCFATARIWVLYVGALSEHQWPPAKFDPDHWYFTKKLEREAREAGLRTWEELLPVLQTFVFSSQVGPSGEIWFDPLITSWAGEMPFDSRLDNSEVTGSI